MIKPKPEHTLSCCCSADSDGKVKSLCGAHNTVVRNAVAVNDEARQAERAAWEGQVALLKKALRLFKAFRPEEYRVVSDALWFFL